MKPLLRRSFALASSRSIQLRRSLILRFQFRLALLYIDMASEGSVPASSGGQMNANIKNKVTIALCFALLVIPLIDGVEASANDPKSSFTRLPLRLRNPRGVGLSHHEPKTSNPVTGEHESISVPEDSANRVQGADTIPRFSHLPAHMHDPRGVRTSRPVEEANADPVSENQVEGSTPEVSQVRFTHLPRLHNPRGVGAVKQIQEAMGKESDKN